MEIILALIIAVLGVWEVIIYIRFVKLRNLLDKTTEAIERYILRRCEIVTELKELMVSLGYQDVNILSRALKMTKKISLNGDFYEKLDVDLTLGDEFKETILNRTDKSFLSDNQEYFYLKDEFLELGKVILQCIELYNSIIINYNKRVLSYPDRAVALFFKIEEKDTI